MSSASNHRPAKPAFSRTGRSLLGAAVAATLALPGAAALAQIEEIVVTVRQRAETIRDVPGAVSVLSASQIQASGVQRAGDFIALTPGVTLVNAAEVADTQVNIRGINGARDAENSFALIIDGVLMTNPAALNREYTNLQQIEILKGPQGAIYGRNAAAGAIIITTQEPGDELGGSVKGSIAQDSSYLLSGLIGGRVNDELRWSVNADWRDTDGYYSNSFLNRDDAVDYFNSWNVGGRLIWEPSDVLKVDSKIRYGEVDAASITFNSVFHLPGLTGFGEAFYADVNEHPFVFASNIRPFNEQQAFEFSVKADYDMDFATLTAWALYSDIDNNLGADGTSGAFGFFGLEESCINSANDLLASGFQLAPPQFIAGPIDPNNPNGGVAFPNAVLGAYTPTTCDGTQFQVRNQEDLSFELRLTSNNDGPLRWQAGFYYLTLEREVGVNTGIDRGFGIVRELFTTNPTNPTEQLVWDQFDTDVYAIFGQVAYDLTDTLEGSLALRYDREEREVRSKVPTDAITQWINSCEPGGAPGGTPINPGLCFGPLENQDRNFSQLQPKGSLTWDFLPDWTAYTSIGVGFKSGGFNNSGSAATIDTFINGPFIVDPGLEDTFPLVNISDRFDKETSLSYEVGVKTELLDRRLRGELSLFRTEVDDLQFFEFIVGPFGLLRVVSNVDEVTIQGIELGGSYVATDWLDFYAGFSILDTEIDKNSARPDTVGNNAPYTPDWTASAGARIDVPMGVGPELRLLGSLDVSWVGDTYFHVVQDQERPTGFGPGEYSVARRDAYEVVNLRLGVGNDSWEVIAFATNLFDKEYLEEVITAPEFGGSFIAPGTERRFGIEATYRF